MGLIVSHDGGQSWQQALGDRLQGLAVFDVAVHPTSSQTVYAATETGLFVTADGGGTWRLVARLPEQARVRTVAINPVEPRNVLAGVDGYGIYVSQDSGDTWRSGYAGLEPNGSLHDIAFDPSNPNIVYASDHSSGVYRSADGGFTWIRINNGLRNRAVTGLAVSADGQHVYVGTHGSGVYRLNLTD